MKKPLVISLALVLFLVLAGFSFYRSTRATLALTVVPKDATVTIDGKKVSSSATIDVPSGKHTLGLLRSGFASYSSSKTFQAGKTATISQTLDVRTEEGVIYMKNHPDEAAIAEGITGKKLTDGANDVASKYPLITKLPYTVRYYTINYGASVASPNDPSKVAIFIASVNETYKLQALQWIRDQGYDPAKYEIIYSGPANAAAAAQNEAALNVNEPK